jgi:NO-binding membrane sensor protein with MHYT domain
MASSFAPVVFPLESSHLIVQSYNGGFITLSYIISVIGSLTTLELLRRVTSARGFLNWYFLPDVAII